MNKNKFSIDDAFSSSWRVIKNNFINYVIAGVLTMGASLAISQFTQSYMEGTGGEISAQSVLIAIASFLLVLYFSYVFLMFMMDSFKGDKNSIWGYFFKKISFVNLGWFVFSNIFLVILGALLAGVIVMLSISVTPWFGLLFLPMAYLTLALLFANYFAAEGANPIKAIKSSWALTKGQILKVLAVVIIATVSYFVVAFLSGLAFFAGIVLGIIFSVAVLLLAIYLKTVFISLYVNGTKNRQVSSPETSA